MLVSRGFTPVLLIVLSGAPVSAQTSLPDAPSSALISQQDYQSGSEREPSSQSDPGKNTKPQINSAPQSASGTVAISDQAPSPQDKQDDSKGMQTKRMLWVVPNFGAVSANTQLPPMSTREKFVLAAHDSVVDYSSYTWAGAWAKVPLFCADPRMERPALPPVQSDWRLEPGHNETNRSVTQHCIECDLSPLVQHL